MTELVKLFSVSILPGHVELRTVYSIRFGSCIRAVLASPGRYNLRLTNWALLYLNAGIISRSSTFAVLKTLWLRLEVVSLSKDILRARKLGEQLDEIEVTAFNVNESGG